jgi:hypothetical protein
MNVHRTEPSILTRQPLREGKYKLGIQGLYSQHFIFFITYESAQ